MRARPLRGADRPEPVAWVLTQVGVGHTTKGTTVTEYEGQWSADDAPPAPPQEGNTQPVVFHGSNHLTIAEATALLSACSGVEHGILAESALAKLNKAVQCAKLDSALAGGESSEIVQNYVTGNAGVINPKG